jgi:hypothetical protein
MGRTVGEDLKRHQPFEDEVGAEFPSRTASKNETRGAHQRLTFGVSRSNRILCSALRGSSRFEGTSRDKFLPLTHSMEPFPVCKRCVL